MTAFPQDHRERGRLRNIWKRDLEREMWRNVDSGLQVQLEEDGDGCTRQSLVATNGLRPIDTPVVTRCK